jgi:PKD repeat protein
MMSTPGTYTVTFTVTDSLGLADPTPDRRVITVTEVVGNPSFESDTSGWRPYPGETTVIERVAGGQEGAFALEVRGPASTAAFGIDDHLNWVNWAPAGTRYRVTAWVRSAGSTGEARIRIREYDRRDSAQVGAATRSAPVTLSPAWQLLSVDHVIGATSSTLDVQVLDYPVGPGEVFQVDNITIRVIP